MDQRAVGRYIAEKRRAKGLTQARLGEKIGVSDKAVSKWETGRCMPDYGIVNDLCARLGITATQLLAGRDNPSDYPQARGDFDDKSAKNRRGNSPGDSLKNYDEKRISDLLQRAKHLEIRAEKPKESRIFKAVQALLLAGLVLAALASVDLGVNAVAAGIPELQDGVSYHSFLQTKFGLLEDMGICRREDFFYAFKTRLWTTFLLFAANIGLVLRKKNRS